MHIKSLHISNFKSFIACNISFNKGISTIIGPNGSGKSNIFDAILFALGEDAKKKLRYKNAQELINKNSRDNIAKVKIVLDIDNKEHIIERELSLYGSLFRLDGKRANKESIRRFLKEKGVNTKNNTILQDEIKKIALYNSKELKSFIERLAGISKIEEKIEDAKKNIAYCENKIENVKKIIEEKELWLGPLKKEMQKAKNYFYLLEKKSDLEKAYNVKKSMQIKRALLDINKRLIHLEKEKTLLSKESDIAKKSIEYLEKEKKTIENKIIDIQRKLIQERSKEERNKRIKREKEEILNKIKGIRNAKDIEKELKYLKEKLNCLEKESIKGNIFFVSKKEDIEKKSKELEKKGLSGEFIFIISEKKEGFVKKDVFYKVIKKADDDIIKATKEKILKLEREISLAKEKEYLEKRLKELKIEKSDPQKYEKKLQMIKKELDLLNKKNKEKIEKLYGILNKESKIKEEIAKLKQEQYFLEKEKEAIKKESNYKKDLVKKSIEALEKEIAKIKEKIISLGAINQRAEKDYKELSKDLDKNKASLKELLTEKEEINKRLKNLKTEKKEKYESCLKTLQKEFGNISKELSINAKLDSEPSLRVGNKSIVSLSGGEKSLIAIAFIIAVLKIKRSGFYLLDEIDAALDFKNTEKVIKLLKELSKESQILLISHNPYTIKESDYVIGITKNKAKNSIIAITKEIIM